LREVSTGRRPTEQPVPHLARTGKAPRASNERRSRAGQVGMLVWAAEPASGWSMSSGWSI